MCITSIKLELLATWSVKLFSSGTNVVRRSIGSGRMFYWLCDSLYYYSPGNSWIYFSFFCCCALLLDSKAASYVRQCEPSVQIGLRSERWLCQTMKISSCWVKKTESWCFRFYYLYSSSRRNSQSFVQLLLLVTLLLTLIKPKKSSKSHWLNPEGSLWSHVSTPAEDAYIVGMTFILAIQRSQYIGRITLGIGWVLSVHLVLGQLAGDLAIFRSFFVLRLVMLHVMSQLTCFC